MPLDMALSPCVNNDGAFPIWKISPWRLYTWAEYKRTVFFILLGMVLLSAVAIALAVTMSGRNPRVNSTFSPATPEEKNPREDGGIMGKASANPVVHFVALAFVILMPTILYGVAILKEGTIVDECLKFVNMMHQSFTFFNMFVISDTNNSEHARGTFWNACYTINPAGPRTPVGAA